LRGVDIQSDDSTWMGCVYVRGGVGDLCVDIEEEEKKDTK